jgi:hypothetical protein
MWDPKSKLKLRVTAKAIYENIVVTQEYVIPTLTDKHIPDAA